MLIDLGKSRTWTEPLYSARAMGNIWFHTPEQFTPAWNYYGVDDIDGLLDDDTAGNYNWWTNLWQVGQLMNLMVGTQTSRADNFSPAYHKNTDIYRR